ncbi:MAG: 50S ribosome-binding GTPase [Bacteroidia bacterium]|nr:50S ribosome-binding GTPase [Bacteroidia bacterium]
MEASATIVAVASPPGHGLRGIVRLSGSASLPICGLSLDLPAGVVRCVLPWNGSSALAVVSRAPRSFTGEDCVELLLPGHPALLDDVVSACIARGARAAEPGEYAARSWLHGKRSIDEAEGIALAIAATSDAQLRAAQRLQQGEAARAVDAARDGAAMLLALVEAGIDFTDQEDVVAIGGRALADRLGPIVTNLRTLHATPVAGAIERPAPWVVLVGPPNAGKSSLFNALLGQERTVASPLAGTTRDAVPEPVSVGGQEVMLVDAPGIEPPRTALDAAMQEQARQAIARAALSVRCVAPGDELPAAAPHELVVLTKMDEGGSAPHGMIVTSAHRGVGLDALRAELATRLGSAAASESTEGAALLPRHRAAIDAAIDELDAAAKRARKGGASLPDAELVAAHLRAGLDALGSIGGSVTPDDVIGLVFARFCVGK